MDSFEYNKIAGAVLGTLTFAMALNVFSEILFTTEAPAKPGYDIVVPEAPAAGGAAPAEQPKPIAELLASADPAKGAEQEKKCQSCHTVEKGGPAKVGPNLYGIVGLPRAHMAGFAYSAAMKAAGGTWTFENLNTFLTNPKAAIPGTAMSFAGIRRDSDRADLIAWLNQNSDKPEPLPTPTAATGATAPQAPDPAATSPAGPAAASASSPDKPPEPAPVAPNAAPAPEPATPQPSHEGSNPAPAPP